MNTYFDRSAYGHSFKPSGCARYVLSQVENGVHLNSAIRQVRIEHGPAQAQEVENLLNDEMTGKNSSDRRSLLPALRRVIKRADLAAAAIMAERTKNNQCQDCGTSITSHQSNYLQQQFGSAVLCLQCIPRNYECDNRHRWTGKDTKANYLCPKCKEPFV